MPTLIRALTWLVRGLVFLLLFLLVMKNTDPVTLHFYFEQSWTAPFALVLFLTLAFGAALGLVAALDRIFAQRREILSLKRELLRGRHAESARKAAPAEEAQASIPPAPDGPPGVPNH